MKSRSCVAVLLVLLLVAAAGLIPSWKPSRAASHREAPLISLDPTADITDFFMFRSYETGKADKVVMIMDVIPGEEPSSGPNYYSFDPNVLYAFNIDNNADGQAEDIQFEFRFRNEFRGVNKDLKLFLAYVALPPITNLDGAGSEGLGMRQKYDVTMVRNGHRQTLAEGLIAVPSNVGPRTMPNYDSLAAQGIYSLMNGQVRVFAGQRDDPFYIDLGAVFDTLNLRNPGTDMLSGFNVHTIALEVPASLLTSDGKSIGDTRNPVLGAYANTSRRKVSVLRGEKGNLDAILSQGLDQEQSGITVIDDEESAVKDHDHHAGQWVQVQRLANPLVNEAIIGTVDKDRWNALEPQQERVFEDYYLHLRLDAALQAVFGASASPLLNVRDLLLKYLGQSDKTPLSELLRLDLRVAPVALASQNRLTVLGSPADGAGWPNGRRPIDDVTDIAIKVIGGTNYLGASDGVNANDKPLPNSFPFISSPWDGRNRFHTNP
jgi:uncharacterized protein DUF4331